jgi:hypothetical protein
VSDRWVPFSEGSPGLILAQQAELEAHGIPTFIPSMQMKTIDPVWLGGNVFDWELHVPASALEAARELLRERAEGGREALDDAAGD